MAKPKGNKRNAGEGNATRRPRQKGKIKHRPEADYVQQITKMSKEIDRVEKAEYDRLIQQGTSHIIAKNLANRAGWAKRNELLGC